MQLAKQAQSTSTESTSRGSNSLISPQLGSMLRCRNRAQLATADTRSLAQWWSSSCSGAGLRSTTVRKDSGLRAAPTARRAKSKPAMRMQAYSCSKSLNALLVLLALLAECAHTTLELRRTQRGMSEHYTAEKRARKSLPRQGGWIPSALRRMKVGQRVRKSSSRQSSSRVRQVERTFRGKQSFLRHQQKRTAMKMIPTSTSQAMAIAYSPPFSPESRQNQRDQPASIFNAAGFCYTPTKRAPVHQPPAILFAQGRPDAGTQKRGRLQGGPGPRQLSPKTGGEQRIGLAVSKFLGSSVSGRSVIYRRYTSRYTMSHPKKEQHNSPGGQPWDFSSSGTQPTMPGYPGTQPTMPGYPGTMPGYPGTQPTMPGYPGTQPTMPGYPGTQPTMPGYPGTMPGYPSYPGTQPTMPGYPGGESTGYPGTQPTMPGYPMQPMMPGYPGTQPTMPGYPTQPMMPGYPGSESTGYPGGYPMQPMMPSYPGGESTGYPGTQPSMPGYPMQPMMPSYPGGQSTGYPGSQPSMPGYPSFPGTQPSMPGYPSFPGTQPSMPGFPSFPGQQDQSDPFNPGMPGFTMPGHQPQQPGHKPHHK